MVNLFADLYRKLIQVGFYIVPIALLMLRLGWGWELFESGRGHLNHLQDTVNFFTSLHIPMPKASVIISGTTELVGGILIMAGLAARAISIPLFFNFCVAYATASRSKVIDLAHTNAAGFSDHFSAVVDDSAYPFLIMSLLILAFGPGLFSVDGILKKAVFKRYTAGLKQAA